MLTYKSNRKGKFDLNKKTKEKKLCMKNSIQS